MPLSGFKYFARWFINIQTTFKLFAALSLLSDPKHGSLYFLLYFLSVMIVFWISAVLKTILFHLDNRNKPSRVYQCRRDLLIGYGGITLCGIVPSILLIFDPESSARTFMLLYCFFGSIPIILYYLFIKMHFKLYNVPRKYFPIKLIILILNYLLAAFFIAMLTSQHHKHSTSAVVIVFLETSFFFCSSVEFGAIAVNGLVLSNPTEQVEEGGEDVEGGMSQNKQQQEGDEVDQENKDQNHSSTDPTCNICLVEYAMTKVIPRILIACGHTVCQACILKLPKQHKNQTVTCPFCRTLTLLPDGLVAKLPKNYAVLDMMKTREI